VHQNRTPTQPGVALHLLGGIWIASCPTCGYQLTTARTQERARSGPAASVARSAARHHAKVGMTARPEASGSALIGAKVGTPGRGSRG
jgi:hypothetical protein